MSARRPARLRCLLGWVGMAAALAAFAQIDDEEALRRQEAFRKHGALQVGSRVTLGPVDADNWSPEQNRYVGAATEVVELVPTPDFRGCYGVRVAIDGGVYFWRVRNLEGQGLRSGVYLECLTIGDTAIPMCVIPLRADVPLYTDASVESALIGTVPLYQNAGDDPSWSLPRHLYVHRRHEGFLQVMESDFGSTDTLGWVRLADVVLWPTRQGYVVDRARSPRRPLLGWEDLADWGREDRALFREDLASAITVDPNQTGMCEGLMLQRQMIRGVPAIRCALASPDLAERQLVWLPFNERENALLPYVLMTEYDLIELSAMFAYLAAACEEGYVDTIKQAIEEEWDLQAKMMVTTKRRSQKYARFYREVQRIYPALTERLALPPGETGERQFREIGERARQSQARVSRLIDEMTASGRTWRWVKLSDL